MSFCGVYHEEDILTGSFAVKIGEPMRMTPRLLIGLERDILASSLAVKGSEPASMPCFQPIRGIEIISHRRHTHTHKDVRESTYHQLYEFGLSDELTLSVI